MRSVMIPRRVFKNRDLSSDAMMSYCVLKQCCMINYVGMAYTNATDMCLYLYGVEPSRYSRNRMADGVRELMEKGIIEAEETKKERFTITVSSLRNRSGESFAAVNWADIVKIARSDYSIPANLLRSLIVIVGSINGETQIGNMSVEYLAKVSGCSAHTMSNHFESLEGMDILVVRRSVESTSKNMYTTMEHVALLHKEANSKPEYRNYNSIVNNMRHTARRYHSLMATPREKWTRERVQSVLDELGPYNEYLVAHSDDNPDYMGRVKDISPLCAFLDEVAVPTEAEYEADEDEWEYYM